MSIKNPGPKSRITNDLEEAERLLKAHSLPAAHVTDAIRMVDRVETALAFYADPNRWALLYEGRGGFITDHGKLARDTLSRLGVREPTWEKPSSEA
jgi:hypothetical protein